MRTMNIESFIHEVEYKFSNPLLAYKDMLREGTIKGFNDEELICILHQLKKRHWFETIYIEIALKIKAIIDCYFIKDVA